MHHHIVTMPAHHPIEIGDLVPEMQSQKLQERCGMPPDFIPIAKHSSWRAANMISNVRGISFPPMRETSQNSCTESPATISIRAVSSVQLQCTLVVCDPLDNQLIKIDSVQLCGEAVDWRWPIHCRIFTRLLSRSARKVE